MSDISEVSEAIKEAEKLNNDGRFEQSNNVLISATNETLFETEPIAPDDWAIISIIFAKNYLGMAKELLEGTGRFSDASDEIKRIAGRIMTEHFGPKIVKSSTGSL